MCEDFADFAFVDVVEDGRLQRIAVLLENAAVDPRLQLLVRDVAGRRPQAVEDRVGVLKEAAKSQLSYFKLAVLGGRKKS